MVQYISKNNARDLLCINFAWDDLLALHKPYQLNPIQATSQIDKYWYINNTSPSKSDNIHELSQYKREAHSCLVLLVRHRWYVCMCGWLMCAQFLYVKMYFNSMVQSELFDLMLFVALVQLLNTYFYYRDLSYSIFIMQYIVHRSYIICLSFVRDNNKYLIEIRLVNPSIISCVSYTSRHRYKHQIVISAEWRYQPIKENCQKKMKRKGRMWCALC